MPDSYIFFVHRSSGVLTSSNGFLGMILPGTLLSQEDVRALRRYLLEGFRLEAVVNLGEKVFGPKVLNTSAILIFSSSRVQRREGTLITNDLRHVPVREKAQKLDNSSSTDYLGWENLVKSDPSYTYFTSRFAATLLYQKLENTFATFEEIIQGQIERGATADYVEAFALPNYVLNREDLEEEPLRALIMGKDISRYGAIASNMSLIYLTRDDNINKYPKIKSYLSGFKNKITCKEVSQGKHPWYALHRPRNADIFSSPKFIGLTTTKRICVALDLDANFYATDALYLFRLKSTSVPHMLFVLGVIHSKLFQFCYQISSQGEQRVIPQIKAAKLNTLPFPISDFKKFDKNPVNLNIVKMVQETLNLNKEREKVRLQHLKNKLDQQIALIDKELDNLVYKIYGLDYDEVSLVENLFQEPED